MGQSKRGKKVDNLNTLAKTNEAALTLQRMIEREFQFMLEDPDSASNAQIQRYNKLVMTSDLPLTDRKRLCLK